MLILRCLLVLSCIATPAVAASVEGAARVIDGDTLDVAGTRVRLFGIDAPEARQTCREAGTDWACGTWAGQMLAEAVEGQSVRCEGEGLDRYGRLLASCSAGGQDLGRRMVQTGAALAYRRYSTRYATEEARAAAAGRGIWSGEMARPEDVRHPAGSTPPGACAIKGNVSSRGRIYHLPGQDAYGRTVISGAEERWFCSPAEAEAQGFRPALR